MKREGLKLKAFLSYDFELELVFKFPLVFMVCFLMQHECMMSYNMSALYVPHQKKKLIKYRWCTSSRWQNALIPVVTSSGMTYSKVLSVPVEENNIHIHTSPLIPQVPEPRTPIGRSPRPSRPWWCGCRGLTSGRRRPRSSQRPPAGGHQRNEGMEPDKVVEVEAHLDALTTMRGGA
jgi:hypothetical protein